MAIYFAQQATLGSVLKESKSSNKWKYSYVIQFVVLVIVLLVIQKYWVTILENTLGLLPIMILHFKSNDKFHKRIASGIVISFLPAVVFLTKFTIHPYFNHIDLSHVLIVISLAVIYLGVKRDAIS